MSETRRVQSLPVVFVAFLTVGFLSLAPRPALAGGAGGSWTVDESRWSVLDTLRDRWHSVQEQAVALDSAVCDPTFQRIKERGWLYNRYVDDQGKIDLLQGMALSAQDNVCVSAHFTGAVVVGAAKEVWGTVQMVLHPIRTIKGLWQAVTHPVRTVKTVGKALVDWKDRFVYAVREDPRQATHMAGEVTGRVAAQVVMSKAAAKALKAGKAKYTAWQADRNSLVTRWRGTDYVDEWATISQEQVLRSKAQWAGYDGDWIDKTIVGEYRHSLDSAKPYSQWVSVTRDPGVANHFGRVFEFQITKKDLHTAWWNKFNEAEDLVRGGTPIYNVREVIPGAR